MGITNCPKDCKDCRPGYHTSYDHHRRLFKESKKVLFYINSRGYVERYLKKNITQHGLSDKHFEKIKMKMFESTGLYQERYLAVIVNHNRYPVKRLVAQYFSKKWKKGSKILFKDGDETNCNILNLIVYPPNKRFGGNRGRKIKFKINGKWKTFPSITAAAKALYVSLPSFKRYINGSLKRPDLSILGEDFEFEFIEENRK